MLDVSPSTGLLLSGWLMGSLLFWGQRGLPEPISQWMNSLHRTQLRWSPPYSSEGDVWGGLPPLGFSRESKALKFEAQGQLIASTAFIWVLLKLFWSNLCWPLRRCCCCCPEWIQAFILGLILSGVYFHPLCWFIFHTYSRFIFIYEFDLWLGSCAHHRGAWVWWF